MPLFTNPDVQRFVEQQTGLNPGEYLRTHVPPPVTPDMRGGMVYPWGTPLDYQAGSSMYDALEGKHFLKPVGNYLDTLGTNHPRAALMTALALGLGGAGFGAVTGRNPITWGLAGAGLGALGGYGASQLAGALDQSRKLRNQQTLKWMAYEKDRKQRQEEAQRLEMTKPAAYYGMPDQDPMTFIQSKLFADPMVNALEKSMLMMNLQSMPRQQLSMLAQMLRAAGGAAVGYIIAKFLGMGNIGQTIGALAGGYAGGTMGPSLPRNAFGEQVDTAHDIFGRNRIIF